MNRKTIAGSSSRAVGPRRTPADADPWLRKTAFSFVQVAPRESKPRQSGLTAIADRGMGLWQIANLIETAGDYIDFAKIAVGMYRLHAEDFIRRKIAAYHKSGIRVFFAGDVSETAMVQGVSGRYYRSLRALGADRRQRRGR